MINLNLSLCNYYYKMTATTTVDTFDLGGLNDDVLGVVMRFIVEPQVLVAVSGATKRFRAIYTNIARMIEAQAPSRVENYFDSGVGKYTPHIAEGLEEFNDDLKVVCYMYSYGRHLDEHKIYAVYDIYYRKCNICRCIKVKYGTINLNNFFRVQLRGVNNNVVDDNIVDEVIVDVVAICESCTKRLENTPSLYYIDYAHADKLAPKLKLDINYKIRKVIMRAFKPITVVNPDI